MRILFFFRATRRVILIEFDMNFQLKYNFGREIFALINFMSYRKVFQALEIFGGDMREIFEKSFHLLRLPSTECARNYYYVAHDAYERTLNTN